MARVYVTSGGRAGGSFGCLGSLLGFVVLILLVAAIAAGAVVLLAIAGVVLVALLVAFAIDRLLLAISPNRRARRDLVQSGGVIDATAHEEGSPDRRGDSWDEPPELPS